MMLTEKDAAFLATLGRFLEEGTLRIECRDRPTPRLVLRRNYGSRIEQAFGMTRQGIRWRFDRIMNQVYARSYGSVLRIEKSVGSGYRQVCVRMLLAEKSGAE